MDDNKAIIDYSSISDLISNIRGQRVILDSDLAKLYNVGTKVFNQATKRNIRRFPADFMFQLTKEEYEVLRSQNVTSSWGGRRYMPYVFTEHGAVMAASVLNSDLAIEISVYIVRAFIQLRNVLNKQTELSNKLTEIEDKLGNHEIQIKKIIDIIRQLTLEPDRKDRKIGFRG